MEEQEVKPAATITSYYSNEAICKLFVGNVNKTTTEEDFKTYFSKFGTLRDIVLMKDNTTPNQNRGFGFVTPECVDVADRILLEPSHTLDSRELDIKRALPKDIDDPLLHSKTNRIFLGGLPHNITEEDISSYFNEKYQIMGVVTEVIIKKERQSGRPRGFCFVSFSNPHLVDKLMVENRFPVINKKRCEIKKADPSVPMTGVPPYQLAKMTQKVGKSSSQSRNPPVQMTQMAHANMSAATACYDYNSYPSSNPIAAYPQTNAYFSYYQNQGTLSNPYSGSTTQQSYTQQYAYGSDQRNIRQGAFPQRDVNFGQGNNRTRPY